MRTKLTLRLEDLLVDSFDTTVPQKEKGTVFGEQCTCPTACTCPGCPTCDNTCPDTCAFTCDDPSCNGTCGKTCNTCLVSCYDTDCGYAYTCGNCTAYQTNCNEICM
jgi:hypothetical protein